MNRKKIILPVLVILISGVLTVLFVKFGRSAQPVPLDPVVPVVEVMRVELTSKDFEIPSQGTVRASTSIPLMSELDGVVNEVASEFQQGSFFSKGDVLLELDATDYEAVVAQAESQLAGARLKLETIQAESKLARQDWEALSSQFHEGATPLLLREPQLKEAQATVRAAEAAWVKARKDLEAPESARHFTVESWQSRSIEDSLSEGGRSLRVFLIFPKLKSNCRWRSVNWLFWIHGWGFRKRIFPGNPFLSC